MNAYDFFSLLRDASSAVVNILAFKHSLGVLWWGIHMYENSKYEFWGCHLEFYILKFNLKIDLEVV